MKVALNPQPISGSYDANDFLQIEFSANSTIQESFILWKKFQIYKGDFELQFTIFAKIERRSFIQINIREKILT